MIRTINNIIRTILLHAHLPPHFWVEALHMAIHLLNITPSSSIHNDIPFTKLFQKPPSLSRLRVFGCLCYPHIPTPHKLAPRSTPCIFLGYPSHHRGFRCYNLATGKIIISRHVTFDEHSFPFRAMTPNQPPSYTFLDTSDDPSPISGEFLTSNIPPSQINTENTPPPSQNENTPSSPPSNHSASSSPQPEPLIDPHPSHAIPPPSHPMSHVLVLV